MNLEEYLRENFGDPKAPKNGDVSRATQKKMLPETQNGEVSRATQKIMPPETSDAPDPRKAELPVCVTAIARSQATLTNAPERVALHKPLAEISREERLLRDEKCLYIKFCWELKRQGRTWPEAARIVALDHARALPRLAAKNMLHENNLRNWRARLCADPDRNRPTSEEPDFRYADNLIRNYGGTTGLLKGDEEFCKALSAICFSAPNQVKLTKEYYQLAGKWMTAYPDKRIPSLAAFRYWLRKLPPRLFALATKGPTHYAQHYQNYVSQDPESIRPNEVWVGDNLECDFYIRGDNGKAVRPWLTAIQDVKSEYIVGMALSDDGVNSAHIRAALAGAVLEYGRPMIFLTDNGSDFCRRGFTTPAIFTPDVSNSASYEHSILKELDIEHRTRAPYNAKAKLVERFFHELNEYSREARGWVGNSIENRPAGADLWSRPENVGHLMDKTQAAEFIAEKLGVYHNRPSRDSKYLKGLSPAQAFMPERRLRRESLTASDLAFAFLTPLPEARTVDPRGPGVRVGKVRYVASEGAERLWHYDNKPVMVKFDMRSIDYCFLFDLDGRFLAVAHTEEELPYFANSAEEKEKLSDTLADIRREEKILRALILRATGGFERLDPRTIGMLPPEAFAKNANVRLLDSKTSVKGDSHNPKIYITAAECKNVSRATQKTKEGAELEKVSPETQNIKPGASLRSEFLAVINGDETCQNNRNIINANDITNEDNKNETVGINPY